MSNNIYFTIGKIFFAIATFPTGLLPLAALFSGKIILVYLSGIAMIVAGIMMLTNKFIPPGALLAAVIWLLFFLLLHLPRLIKTYNSPNEWTPTFEVAMLFSGALILLSVTDPAKNYRFKLSAVARYIFAIALLVFAILHFKYAAFVATLVTPWIPFHLFWAYFAGLAFLAVAISLVIQKLMHLSTILLGLMFFLWFLVLHIPLVIASYQSETQWTSIAVVLAASGISFLFAGWAMCKPSINSVT